MHPRVNTQGKVPGQSGLSQHMEKILQSVRDAVITTDDKGIVTMMNLTAENLTGWSQQDAVGRPLEEVFQLCHEKTGERIAHVFENIVKEDAITILSGGAKLIDRAGRKRSIMDSVTPVWNGNDRFVGLTLVFYDVTESMAMEAKMRQFQKMESIGTLAGGIAHDFNNILFGIMGNMDLAMAKLPEDSDILRYLRKSYQAGLRAKELIKQILTFSRQQEQELRPMAFAPIIKESVKLLRATLPTTISVETNIDTDEVVMADITQIYQVMINLCTNASQAMQEKGGRIRINLTAVDLDMKSAVIYPELKPGRYVKLIISDTGHGIAPEVENRIFDPYFTTSQSGEGSGLGLSVVHGIVRNHGGAISVFSEPGEGAVFELFFPVSKRKEPLEMVEVEKTLLPMGEECILIVDDETQVLQVERHMLNRLGYQVLAYSKSLEALSIFRSDPGRFDLVVTDMTMPNMTGAQLAEEIRKIRSDVPIVLCSGYYETLLKEKFEAVGINAFVRKPIALADFAEIIRNVLDQNLAERRKSKRFLTAEEAVAIIKSDPIRNHHILDISWGGLAIDCREPKAPGLDFDELAIKLVNKGFVVDNIPCHAIAVMESKGEAGREQHFSMRQGISFGDLSYSQKEMLEYFIENYTVKE